MALDSYAGLKTGIADFLGRSDTTASVDYMIDLCEAWLNENLRTHDMETTNGSMTASSGLIAHPSDFLGWKNLSVTSNGTRYQLQPLPLEGRSFYDDGNTDMPRYYTVRGGSTLLVPAPDSSTYTYEGTYYQKIPALTDAASINWVLTNHPGAYLFGSLANAESFYKDDSRIPGWKSLAQEALMGILERAKKADLGQVPVMRYQGPVY